MENGNYRNLLESPNEQDHRDLNMFNSSTEVYDQEDANTFQKCLLTNDASASVDAQMIISTPVESNVKSKKRQNNNRDSMNRPDSVSDCSDQNDDEEENNDGKYRSRNGKGGAQCKNLEAERKRRKKLNERLYNLRSLVPKITKLDRASILGDAIEYVMELKQQVTDLQNELERNIDDGPNDNQSTLQPKVVHGSELKIGSKSEHGKVYNYRARMGPSSSNGTEVFDKKNQNSESTNDHKMQQMEPQVEVIQLDRNELFVKIFCEYNTGGFLKLMEAFSSLRLEVTSVNVSSLLSLVLNVFKVERKDCAMIEADHVRESLLDLTRNPTQSWPKRNRASPEMGFDHNNYHHLQHHFH